MHVSQTTFKQFDRLCKLQSGLSVVQFDEYYSSLNTVELTLLGTELTMFILHLLLLKPMECSHPIYRLTAGVKQFICDGCDRLI